MFSTPLNIHTLIDQPFEIQVERDITIPEFKLLVSKFLFKVQKIKPKDIHLYYLDISIEGKSSLFNAFPIKAHSPIFLENPKALQICEQILLFKKSSDNYFDFPKSLTNLERRFVHAICDEVSLYHNSLGEGNNRFIRVSKNPIKRSKIPIGISEIIPNFLYLGSGEDANDYPQLMNFKITHILNVTKEWKRSRSQAIQKMIQYKRIPLKDEEDQDLSSHLNEAFEFLLSVYKNNGRVLVHCAIGKSRSAACVIGFIMKHKQLTLYESYQHVLQKRPIIKPNDGFIRQLMKLELELFPDLEKTTLDWKFTGKPNHPKKLTKRQQREAARQILDEHKKLAKSLISEAMLKQGVKDSVKKFNEKLMPQYLKHMQSVVKKQFPASSKELKEMNYDLFMKEATKVICGWYRDHL